MAAVELDYQSSDEVRAAKHDHVTRIQDTFVYSAD